MSHQTLSEESASSLGYFKTYRGSKTSECERWRNVADVRVGGGTGVLMFRCTFHAIYDASADAKCTQINEMFKYFQCFSKCTSKAAAAH